MDTFLGRVGVIKHTKNRQKEDRSPGQPCGITTSAQPTSTFSCESHKFLPYLSHGVGFIFAVVEHIPNRPIPNCQSIHLSIQLVSQVGGDTHTVPEREQGDVSLRVEAGTQ